MNALYEIEFGWSSKPNLDVLRSIVGNESVVLKEDGELAYGSKKFVMTIEQALSVSDDFKVVRSVNNQLSKQLDEITIRLDSLIKTHRESQPKLNEKCGSISVPDSPLFNIKRVEVCEDCCTNLLQDKLNEGWFILAVCPQPQRRPDYVLGSPNRI